MLNKKSFKLNSFNNLPPTKNNVKEGQEVHINTPGPTELTKGVIYVTNPLINPNPNPLTSIYIRNKKSIDSLL